MRIKAKFILHTGVCVVLLIGGGCGRVIVNPTSSPTTVLAASNCGDVVGCGAKGDGVTDDTAAILGAYSSTPVGGTLLIPLAQAGGCFKVTEPIVITKAISVEGAGWSAGSWGMHFGEEGFLSHFSGSVICSTVTSGTAFTVASPAAGLHYSNFAVVGPGSGTSTGVSFGDAAGSQYLNQGTVNNVFSGNFGNPILIFSQNSTYDSLKVDGAAADGSLPDGAGVYMASTDSGTSNANHFSGLVIAGGGHVNLYAQGQSNDFAGLDLENPAPNDPTAVSLYSYNCNECTFSTGYVESAAGQTFTGEDILVDGPATHANSIGATFINMHISGGPTSMHIAHATHTTVLGGQMGRVVIDAGPTNLYTVDMDSLVDNSVGSHGTGSNILTEGGVWAGSNPHGFGR